MPPPQKKNQGRPFRNAPALEAMDCTRPTAMHCHAAVESTWREYTQCLPLNVFNVLRRGQRGAQRLQGGRA